MPDFAPAFSLAAAFALLPRKGFAVTAMRKIRLRRSLSAGQRADLLPANVLEGRSGKQRLSALREFL
ncbi:conserved protein of unknown function [Desulfovibrio sp. 86]|nr:conserved protein of unknown function [Desulfovibrio sp. 86]